MSICQVQFELNNKGTHLSVPMFMTVPVIKCNSPELYEEGYDSAAEIGLFFDAVEDEEDPESYSEDTLQMNDAAPATNSEPSYMPLLEEDIKKMKVTELKDELKKHKLSMNGNKGILMEHLLQAHNLPPASNVSTKNQQPAGFSDGSKWRTLEPDMSNPRVEPNKIRPCQAYSTCRRKGIQKKNDFNEQFDRTPLLPCQRSMS